MATINPWQVHSVEAFLYLKCPECRFDTQEEEVFQEHALENHSLSYVLFGKEVKLQPFVEFENSNNSWIKTDLDSVKTETDFSQTECLDENVGNCAYVKEEFIDTSYDGCDNSINIKREHCESTNDSVDKTEDDLKLKQFALKNKRKQILIKRDVESSLNVQTELIDNKNDLTVHEEKKPFKCSLCDVRFTQKSAVRSHVKIVHEGEKPFVCSTCGYATGRRNELARHIESVHEKKRPFKCPDCEYCCPSKSQLRCHINNIHLGKRPHKCPTCDKAFKVGHHLRTHIKMVHEGLSIMPYKCSLCGQKFGTKKQMVTHIEKTHNEANPFKCDVCAKTFSEEWKLKMHIASGHEGAQPNECYICGVKLRKQHIKRHLLTVHEEKKAINLRMCPFCDKGFNLPHHVKQHVEIVHEKRKLLCSHCGSAFSTNGNLKQHVTSVHEKHKLHNCHICGVNFALANYLKRHIAKVHVENMEQAIT